MANSKSSSNQVFYLLIAAVAVVGGYLLLNARGSDGVPELAPVPLAGGDVAADMSSGTALGPEDAPAVIMEFSDYLCPYCRTFNSLTGKLIRQNYGSTGDLRWVSFDFPLNPASWAPAIAAQCAKRQGAYWQMKDLLFARVDSWGRDANPNDKFVDYARDLGLDAGAFEECVEGQETVREVQAARVFGETLGVSGTPTIYFNGEPVSRGRDYAGLEQRIQAAAAAATDAATDAD